MTLDLNAADRPYLPRGVRMHKDRVRGGVVLLAPEKAILLDDIGVAILSRVDGERRFGEIIADLAQTFKAPAEQIETDVQQFLGGLRARMYLGVTP
ncbi:pyrroloquinoline quinone biosynthesis peptide chaperone PqqD [Profundibacter amoris]|uniref:Pyrroloquinoline quinone biosynthesis peptide chaperone PqqD n=1 Tax=Profundibacter amoris TaxID=2171755 RepID=A0A347UCV2_9RHOB|nr:pyrroloquinoline quinone biosynthesis peptide chaperone PqqD [Profundibacter amoris]AXX96680.1 pyrroloquinoline quinone biosynthesis peptide chaperone PqqD [Profundibacter amoris]